MWKSVHIKASKAVRSIRSQMSRSSGNEAARRWKSLIDALGTNFTSGVRLQPTSHKPPFGGPSRPDGPGSWPRTTAFTVDVSRSKASTYEHEMTSGCDVEYTRSPKSKEAISMSDITHCNEDEEEYTGYTYIFLEEGKFRQKTHMEWVAGNDS